MNLQSVAPSVASEIGQAAGAYPGMVQQYQANQAALDAQKIQNASARLAQIQQIFGANPSLAQGPQAMQTVTQLYKQMGVPAPIDPKTGQIDLAAMGAHAPFQIMLSDPAKYAVAMSYAPGPDRDAYFISQSVDPNSVPPTLRGAKQRVISNPTEAAKMFDYINQDVHYLAMGQGEIGSTIGLIQGQAQVMDQNLGQGSSAALISSLNSTISPWAAALIQKNLLSGALDAKKIPEIQALTQKAIAETDLDKKKTILDQIDAMTRGELNVSKIEANMARVTSASAAVSNAESRAKMVDATIHQMQATTPGSKEWNAGMKSLDDGLKTATTARDKAQGELDKLSQDTTMNQAGLAQQRNALQLRVNQLNSQIDGYTSAKQGMLNETGIKADLSGVPDVSTFNSSNVPPDGQIAKYVHNGKILQYKWDASAAQWVLVK